jgi:hypothetical protein
MMEIFARIAEEKIKEAMQNGEFDHLPGKGKPLQLDELSHIPEDLRLGYKVMKNAGMVPEEVHLNKEIASLRQLLEWASDPEQRETVKRQLTAKQLRFDMLMEARGTAQTGAFSQYRSKLFNRLF